MAERVAYFDTKHSNRNLGLPPRPAPRPVPTPTEGTAPQTEPIAPPTTAGQTTIWVNEDQLRERVDEWVEKRFMELLDKHRIVVEDK